MGTIWTTITNPISLAAHKLRHQFKGADEIDLTGLSGAPADVVAKALFDAYTMLYADTDNTPAALSIAASRIVGRKATGGVAALTGAEALALMTSALKAELDILSGIPGTLTATELGYVDGVTSAIQTQLDAKVAKSLYDAYTILIATADDTPVALTVAEQTLVGRITEGVITALTVAQVRTLLNLAEGTHIADPTGGAVVDTEARATINAILVRLEEKDINATS